ncbi:hypothetical protein [Crateriforma conspicua]|nr:hypothetical protein [Crateriforma conspicua]
MKRNIFTDVPFLRFGDRIVMIIDLHRALQVTAFLLIGFSFNFAHAFIATNPSLPVTKRLTIQPIVVANNDGLSQSTFMGDPSDEIEIRNWVSSIWSQAGIGVSWLAPEFRNDTFINYGDSPFNGVRPVSDLDVIVASAGSDPANAMDSHLLRMFFVQIVPGQESLSSYSIAGRAQVDESGSAMFVGADLPGAQSMGESLGNQIIARVIAHEIGHNLDLPHVNSAENLMRIDLGEFPTLNARLSSQQVTTARQSRFATAIPEPNVISAVFAATGCLIARHRRRVRSNYRINR